MSMELITNGMKEILNMYKILNTIFLIIMKAGCNTLYEAGYFTRTDLNYFMDILNKVPK